MEDLQRVGLLAHGDELDGLAGDLADRERAAAAGIAVQLGHDDAVKVHAVGELGDHVDDVLAGHGVHDHENLVGLDRLLDGDGLLHHLLVDLQAAGGVHDDDVVQVVDGLLDGAGRHLDGVLAVAAKDRDADLAAKGGQLVGRGRAVRVAGGQKRAMALALEEVGQLGGGGGLAGALQAHHHDDVGRAVLGQDQLGLGGAQKLRELVKHDAHDVLGGRQGVQDLGGHALLLAASHELLDHAEVDVCLEKRHADLAHGEVDVVLGQAALAAQLVEGVLEAVGERVEHALHPFTNERGTEVVRVEGLQVVNGLANADAVDGQAQLA